jgi:hypothetical protein
MRSETPNGNGFTHYLASLGDTENWIDVVHEISRRVNKTIDQRQQEEFKQAKGHVPEEQIASFDLQQCKTLAHVICRILYWTEPQIFSINGRPGVIKPEPFAFEHEVRALSVRTLELLSEP